MGEDLNLGSFMWIGLGSIGTVGAFAVGLPSPIFGWLADRYPRGVMMVISLFLAGFGSLIIGVFGEIFLFLALGIILMGLGVSLYHPAGLSWVSRPFIDSKDNHPSPYFNRILGIHGVGGTIGSSIAPISVFLLIDLINWRQIYLLWSFPLFILGIIFWAFIGRFETSNRPFTQTTVKRNFTYNGFRERFNPYFLLIFLFIALMALTWGMISFILSPFLSEVKGFKISEAALFIGITHLIAASGQILGGIMGDRYSERVALLFAVILQINVLIGIYIASFPLLLFILYIFIHIVNTIFWPVTNSLLARSTQFRGRAFGNFMLVVNVVRSFGPSIVGILISFFPDSNYLPIFYLSLVLSFGAIIALYLQKNRNS